MSLTPTQRNISHRGGTYVLVGDGTSTSHIHVLPEHYDGPTRTDLAISCTMFDQTAQAAISVSSATVSSGPTLNVSHPVITSGHTVLVTFQFTTFSTRN